MYPVELLYQLIVTYLQYLYLVLEHDVLHEKRKKKNVFLGITLYVRAYRVCAADSNFLSMPAAAAV